MHKFMKYIMEHGKSYLTESEFMARLDLFRQSDDTIYETNARQSQYRLGHNFMSDLSEYEKYQYQGRIPD
jgi:hypothetical protein